MKTPEGHRSMLVIRPADAFETVAAWKLALECVTAPCALLLSRQNIAEIPGKNGATRLKAAFESDRGGYIAFESEGKPDVILAANGSEVATLIDAAKLMKSEKGINARIVSVPSTALFLEQPADYRESIMPFGMPVFGLTAGLPTTLADIVGPLGKVSGLDRFGASAPYKVLDDKFGYTPEKVKASIYQYLAEYDAMKKKLL